MWYDWEEFGDTERLRENMLPLRGGDAWRSLTLSSGRDLNRGILYNVCIETSKYSMAGSWPLNGIRCGASAYSTKRMKSLE